MPTLTVYQPEPTPGAHGSPFVPTQYQLPILYVIAVYAFVIFAVWNIPVVCKLISPFKLFTIGWHELCHIIVAILTGGKVLQVCIDPSQGGCTQVEGGHPLSIVSAGYIGSTLLGATFVLAGFDTLMSKKMSWVIGFGLILPLAIVRDKRTILLTVVYEGLLIGFWFIDHAQALRWYCLFVGVMHVFYCVWEVTDEKYSRTDNGSDATQFGLMFPTIPAHVWATIWILFEIGVLISFILLGIAIFKRTPEQMYHEASRFLPT